jgi:predicted dehydrogenase
VTATSQRAESVTTGADGPVGVAVIGCGVISDQYLANLTRFPDITVIGCADLDLARAAEQAAKYGVPHSGDPVSILALPEVDLVVNLTTPAVHAAVAIQAITAGKHVYGEKPFALTVKEAEAVLAAADQHGVRLGNAPDTFLGAGLQTARRLIEQGRIGTPTAARATFATSGPDQWHPNPAFLFQTGGGPLLDMGPYYLTALVQILGPVARVAGFGRRAQLKRTIIEGPLAGEQFDVTVDTHVVGLLEFVGGQVANVTFSFDSPHAVRELEILGTAATLRLPDPNMFTGSVLICNKGTDEWVEIPATGSAEGRGTGVLDMVRALGAGTTARASASTALHVLDVMETLTNAAAAGQTLAVASTCTAAEPLPDSWNPLERSK